MAKNQGLPALHKAFSVQKVDPMSTVERIIFTLFFVFGVALTITFGLWWFEPAHVSHNWSGVWHIFDFVLFGLLSYIVWHQIAMEVFAWYVSEGIRHPESNLTPQSNLRVAYLTAFVPGAEPYDVLEKTLEAMVEVSYPHDTWLLDEGNDDEAKRICKRLGVKHFSRKGKEMFNTAVGKFQAKTKGGNYNSWLHQYSGAYDIVAQHDVDFIPKKEFLTRTLGYFRDPEVAFVGMPQVYGNIAESWIARGAAEQTFGFYGPIQKGLYGHDMALFVGANHIVRMQAYIDLDGYSAHITEDMLTGMKLYTHEKNWKSVYVPEVLLVGEGPTTWGAYFGQQMRWAYGCMDIALRHAPSLMPKLKPRHIFNYLWLMQFYYSGVAQVAGIIMLTAYFLFGVTSADMTLLPILILYLPLFIYQIIFHLWLQKFNVYPKGERGLGLRGKLLFLAASPIYFLAYIGVLRGKRLTYVVTPKGGTQKTIYEPSLFTLHFFLGSLTLVGMCVGVLLDHTAGPILFWAILNTVIMYYLYLAEAVPAFRQYMRPRIKRMHVLGGLKIAGASLALVALLGGLIYMGPGVSHRIAKNVTALISTELTYSADS